MKGALSPLNQERWERVAPLVFEARSADTSLVCDRNASEIINILGITEPDIPGWLKRILEELEAVEGSRGNGDPAETLAPQGKPLAPAETAPDQPFDGAPLPHPHGRGRGKHVIEPRPYWPCWNKCSPWRPVGTSAAPGARLALNCAWSQWLPCRKLRARRAVLPAPAPEGAGTAFPAAGRCLARAADPGLPGNHRSQRQHKL